MPQLLSLICPHPYLHSFYIPSVLLYTSTLFLYTPSSPTARTHKFGRQQMDLDDYGEGASGYYGEGASGYRFSYYNEEEDDDDDDDDDDDEEEEDDDDSEEEEEGEGDESKSKTTQ